MIPLSRCFRRNRLALLGLIALVGIGVLGGCVQLKRGGLFAKDRDEVFVGYFLNETFYRDVEFELTEHVHREILSRPGLRLSSKEGAEILLSGRVVNVRQTVLSEDPQQDVTSRSTSVTAVIEIKDARTGVVIKTKRLTQRGEFVNSDSASSPNRGLDDARREAFAFLARDIVRELETEFE